jgi:hypothetical protein
MMEALPPEAAVVPAAPGASAVEAILDSLASAGPTLAGLPATAVAGVAEALPPPAAPIASAAGIVDTAGAVPIGAAAPAAPAAGVEGLFLPAPGIPPAATVGTTNALSMPQLNWSTLANLPQYPQLLPNQLSMPHDLVCAGTAWPASVQNFVTLPAFPPISPGRPIQ